MNQPTALARLSLYLAPDEDPVIEQSELELLLEANAQTTDADGNAPGDDGWTPTYSVQGVYRAAAEGWKVKSGRVANRFDFTTDGQTFRRSQMHDHCEAQAARFLRLCNGSVPSGASTGEDTAC